MSRGHGYFRPFGNAAGNASRQNHCLEYGRQLAAENPRYGSEIIEQTNVSIGNAQLMTNAWLP